MSGSHPRADGRENNARATDAAADEQRTVQECDLRESRRFSAAQVQQFEGECHVFCREAGRHVSSYLGTNVTLELIGTEQVAFENFLASVADPPLLARFHCPPLRGVGVLEVPMSVAYRALGLMTGGMADSSEMPERLPTDLELGLVRCLSRQMLVGLKAVWGTSMDFDPHVPDVTTSAESLDVVPPTEAVMVVRMNVICGDTEGLATVCLSSPLARGLAGWERAVADAGPPDAAGAPQESARLSSVPMPVVARLGSTTVTLRHVLGLTAGTILPLDQPTDEPLDIEINGVPKFRGNAGVRQGRLAVRISDVVAQSPGSGKQ